MKLFSGTSTRVRLTSDLPEGLRDEPLDGLEPLDDEAHGGELAAAVAEQLVGQLVGELFAQLHRLETREGRADPEIQLLPARRRVIKISGVF